jgi:hypothetical protein
LIFFIEKFSALVKRLKDFSLLLKELLLSITSWQALRWGGPIEL